MATPKLTSRERRGILAVAGVALMVTGVGVTLRLMRPELPPPSTTATLSDSVRIIAPEDTTPREKKDRKRKTSKKSKKSKHPNASRNNRTPGESPLDRPVKTL